MWTDRTASEFTSRVLELDNNGTLTGTKEYDFNFESDSVEKEYESYRGLNACLRYFVRVTVTRNYSSNLVQEQEFWVQNTTIEPEIDGSIKMEVGIEDCLHIEFEYNKQKCVPFPHGPAGGWWWWLAVGERERERERKRERKREMRKRASESVL